jgi:hypothetical protein
MRICEGNWSRPDLNREWRFCPEEMTLAKQVIATFEGPLDFADYKDEYREGLQRIIDAKIAGEEVVAPAVEAPPRVVNLMDALKKSLDAVSATKKKPAKAAVAQPAAKRKTRVTGSNIPVTPHDLEANRKMARLWRWMSETKRTYSFGLRRARKEDIAALWVQLLLANAEMRPRANV